VSGVDENGSITAVELVPWYRTPEFKPGQCVDEITQRSKKTKFWATYNRVLCHPRSVDIPGEGYSVGNSIEWYCTDPNCETYEPAVAYVTDVDDKGGVLDWRIRGSDICMYGYGGYSCGMRRTTRTPGPTAAADEYPQADDRGSYKFDGKRLCELRWTGTGNPVRAAGRVQMLSQQDYLKNVGTLTSVDLNITRSPCRTGLNVYVMPYRYESLAFLSLLEDTNPGIQNQLLKWFPPYPRCEGGGAVLSVTCGDSNDPLECFGGPIVGGDVVEPGVGYAFADKRHVHPVLDKNVPSISGENGTGSGAVISSFDFSSVMGFPAVGYATGEAYQPASDRFAYYPVSGATIDSSLRGSGYEVGMEFDVKPVDGVEFTDAWSAEGGDNPDISTNGNWYGGRFASQLTEDGMMSPEFDGENNPQFGTETRNPWCRLRVSGVDTNGGITDLEVIHGGMMFKPEWSQGFKHPSVATLVLSDTGHNATFDVSVDDNINSAGFGGVNGVAISNGGVGYANPEGGWMWELLDVNVGPEVFSAPASLMAHINWSGWLNDPFDSENSSGILVQGDHPPVVPRRAACCIGECYHPLLNRTYALHRVWNMNPLQGNESTDNVWNDYGNGASLVDGWPPYDYGIYRNKNAEVDSYWGTYPHSSYTIVEWGMTLTLSAEATTPCPDHSNGRTAPW